MAERPADRTAGLGAARQRKLRHVDPHAQRSRLYFAVARLSATKFGAWFSVNVAWKLDPFLLKAKPDALSPKALRLKRAITKKTAQTAA